MTYFMYILAKVKFIVRKLFIFMIILCIIKTLVFGFEDNYKFTFHLLINMGGEIKWNKVFMQ